MKSTPRQLLNDMNLTHQLSDLMTREKFKEAIELLTTRLGAEEEPTMATRYFWFQMAVCRDMLAQPLESLVIFNRLVEKFPNVPTYIRSYEICCTNLLKRTMELATNPANDSLVVTYAETLRQFWWTGQEVDGLVAEIYIRQGTPEKAKALLLPYLELAPGDADYLAVNLRVARKAQDTVWEARVMAEIKDALWNHPYRLDLVALESGTESESAQAN